MSNYDKLDNTDQRFVDGITFSISILQEIQKNTTFLNETTKDEFGEAAARARQLTLQNDLDICISNLEAQREAFINKKTQ